MMIPSGLDDAARRSGQSHIRLTSTHASVVEAVTLAGRIEWLDALELLDELCDEHEVLDRALSEMRSPLLPLLVDVREALAGVHQAAVSSAVHRCLLPSAALGRYLRSVYPWVFAVLDALGGDAPWSLADANALHLVELAVPIRAELADLAAERGAPAAVRSLQDACEALFEAAIALEVQLDEEAR